MVKYTPEQQALMYDIYVTNKSYKLCKDGKYTDVSVSA
jgi:hypothetical protein